MGQIRLSREELYEKIWSVPTIQLAKLFGISDVAVAKICKKHHIPKPPLGYWAKVANGHKLRRVALPFLKEETLSQVIIRKRANLVPKINQERVRPVINFVSSAPSIPCHPLAQKTHAILSRLIRERQEDKYGRFSTVPPGCINVSVSRARIDKALHVLDVLIKGLESSGYSITTRSHKNIEEGYAKLVVGSQKMDFRIEETSDRIEKTPPVSGKKDYFYDRWSYVPSGRLYLIIDEYAEKGWRTKWLISENCPLEETLNSFAIGLIETAKILKVNNDEWERQRLVWEEQARHEREEAERVSSLRANAAAWREIQTMKSFILAVEQAAIEKFGLVDSESNLARWLNWARQYVKNNDPIEKMF